MKNIKLKLLSIFFLLTFQINYGQNNASKEKFSVKEFEKLRIKTENIVLSYPDSASIYASKLISFSKKLNNEELYAKALLTSVKINVFSKEALSTNQKALDINLKLNKIEEVAKSYTLFGAIYLNNSDYPKAIEYFNKSLEISTQKKLYVTSKKNYRSLSTLYALQENYPKSLYFANEALKLEKSAPNDLDKAFAYICLADYYDYTEVPKSSNKYYQLAYDLFKKNDSQYNMATTLMNWSIVYEESNPVRSFEMEFDAQKIFDKIYPESLYSCNNLGNMGDGLFDIVQNDSLLKSLKNNEIPKTKNELVTLAENYYSRSLQILKKEKNAYGLFYISGNLAQLQAYKSDYKNAYSNLLLSKKLNDSIFSQKNKNAIAKLESEKEVLQLKTQNDKNATLNKILIGSSIAIILLSFLGYRNFRNKQKIQNLKIKELEKDKQLSAVDAMLKGQEEERSRIAKDLHDGLGGLLSGTKLSFTNMKENLILTPENASLFDKSLSMLDNTISDLRKVAHNLMPESLVKFGLIEALKDFCGSIQSASNIKIDYQKIGAERKISNTAEVFIYRIIQELVNNAVKHSKANEIMVQLAYTNNKIAITVEDDGVGYDFNEAKLNKGSGLENIAYRVDYFNGTIDTITSPSNGTSVNIELNA